MKRNTKLFILSLAVRICGLFRLTRTARATAYLNYIDTYINNNRNNTYPRLITREGCHSGSPPESTDEALGYFTLTFRVMYLQVLFQLVL